MKSKERNLAIIGCGEMAQEVYHLVMTSAEKANYDEVFFVDLEADELRNVRSEEDFFNNWKESSDALIAMGEPAMRQKVAAKYEAEGCSFATFVHPSAIVSPEAKLEPGVLVLPFSYIAQNTVIAKNTLIHAGAKIENDCAVGAHCVISVNTFIGAKTVVEDSCFVGPNAAIRDSLMIGANTIIGMGSNVTKSVETESVCYGNPAVRVRTNTTHRVFS